MTRLRPSAARGALLSTVRWLVGHPRLALALHLVPTVALAAGLAHLELATDGAALHPAGDPVIEADRADRLAFGEPDQAILLLTSLPGGAAVASPAGLRTLARLHGEVGAIEGVDFLAVRSLASLLEPPATGQGQGATVRAVRYLAEIPSTEAELADLLRRIGDHPLAAGLYLASDGRAAPLFLPLARDAGRVPTLERIESWLAGDPAPGFRLRLTGPLVGEATLGRAVLHDLLRLAPLVALAIVALLALTLRSPAAILVVGVEAAAVVVWTLGAMGHLGVPITLVTTLLPAVLVAIAVVDEVHLLERVGHHAELGLAPADAAVAAVEEIARPVVLTSLTTGGALLSFAAADIPPVRHFGIFAALGIGLAMVATFTLIPALLALLPASWVRRRTSAPAEAKHRGLGALAARRPALGAAIVGLAVLAALPGLARLSVQDSWVSNFAPGSDLVSAERDFNRHFWGSYRFDLVCYGDDPRGEQFRQPAGLALIERLRDLARAAPETGGVVSHLLPYELVARAWGLELPLSRLDPAEVRRLDARLGPVKPRIDLHQMLTRDGRSARLRVVVPSADYRRGDSLRRRLEGGLATAAEGSGATCHASGEIPVGLRVVEALVGDQLRSLGWTVGGLGLLLALVGGGPRRALVVLAPVVAAAVAVFGAMGYLGVPLGIATSMFAALSIGVGVDFAVHYAHRWDHHRNAGESPERAALGTLATAGRALRGNALVLALGFSVLALSELRPSRSLGLLLAAAVAAGYAATVLALPWLLSRLEPRKEAALRRSPALRAPQ